MRWLSLVTTVAFAAALSIGGVGCAKKEQASGKGEGGKELTLTAPGNTDIKQGESIKVTVKVSRKGFDDPVDVTFSDLPKGVTVADADKSIPKDKDSADFNLKAADDAAPIENHTVKVTAKGGGASPEATFKLTVKEKKK